MSLESYLTFCLAAAALALAPGPTVAVIIANSLKYGSRAGLVNVLGTQTGMLIWMGIAAFGLSAAIAVMGVWFDVLRIGGAAYLIWLGIKLFRSNGDLGAADAVERDSRGLFLQGFIVILSNPKIIVLFGAMIPPFLTPGGDAWTETLVLGGTFTAIALMGDTAYALMAGRAGDWLSRSRVRAVEIVSGMFLTAGGLWMAAKVFW